MKRILFIFFLVAFLTGFWVVPATAHWSIEDGHKMHYPQLADETGWAVNATYPVVLADDWLCTESGPVQDIHFWGAWQNDFAGNPYLSGFVLSIHADIPADPSGETPSMPGPLLWEYEIPIQDVLITDAIETPGQGWYDPQSGETKHPDHFNHYQYNILLTPDLWFEQTEGTIYWLNITAKIGDEPIPSKWGWKSSEDHWNDDAYWGVYEGPQVIWLDELYEPPLSGETPVSLDLAFVITGEGVDFGDAPETGTSYPTKFANNGARHVISQALYFGASVDKDNDGQPNANATGDDNDGTDDEDGVTFTSRLIKGKVATVDVVCSGSGNLDAWIDFNDDGDWADACEQIFTSHPVVAGTNNLIFSVYSGAVPTKSTYARFRLSTAGGLSDNGLAFDGEVEDYKVTIYPVSIIGQLLLLLLSS